MFHPSPPCSCHFTTPLEGIVAALAAAAAAGDPDGAYWAPEPLFARGCDVESDDASGFGDAVGRVTGVAACGERAVGWPAARASRGCTGSVHPCSTLRSGPSLPLWATRSLVAALLSFRG